jgi:enoyl-CoA hydratase
MPNNDRPISVEARGDGVVELVIERPPVNAFSIELLDELADRIAQIGAAPDTHAIVLRAQGRGFCGGGDVKEAEALPDFGGILGQARGSLAASLAILDCPVPVICAVHNYCVGVGVLLAGCADVILASEDAHFVLAEVDNGATAGGVMALRLMSDKRVRAAMMTAEPVRAAELYNYGSVHKIVSTALLADAAIATASTIAAKDPESMRRLKRSLRHSSRSADLEAAYRAELSYTYELNMMGQASAGRSAFIDGARPGYRANDGAD